ncbi:unnamed protein product [Phytophthora lilii]|uniref:RxLR effector protein n=1 Tax=Phytophthora lilii TaxID=2077276 RepID=A0A9W6WUR2_9STRA|nr:unnamed protein product [Phytophthora lilii]
MFCHKKGMVLRFVGGAETDGSTATPADIAVVSTVIISIAGIESVSAATEAPQSQRVTVDQIRSLRDDANYEPNKRWPRTAQADNTDADHHVSRRLMKKLPATFVNDLLAKESSRLSTFETWKPKVSVDRLAKSLDLKSTRFKWFNDFMNQNKKQQVELLELYRKFKAQPAV